MRNFQFLFAFLGLLGCSQSVSNEKLRDVKTFSFEIRFSNFSNESGVQTIATPTEIKRVSISPQHKNDSTKVNLTSEQATQIKNALEKIPFSQIKKEYRNKRIVDGGAISFSFDIDGKKYETSYINYPLHPNLEELKNTIKKLLGDEK